MISVSAPGKVHLIGEHAVVYNKPAIIAAIGLRCRVSAEKSDKISVESKEPSLSGEFSSTNVSVFNDKITVLWHSCFEEKNFSPLFKELKKDELNSFKAITGKALEKLGIVDGISIKIDSSIPIGAGLGSSSALAVAITKAAATLYRKNLPDEKINEIAYECEKIMHGTPSGGDNSTCCFGGLIWFQKGNPNIIKSLKKEVPYRLDNFVLVHTGKPEKTTGELVQLVRNLDEDFRSERIDKIETATYKMLDVLKKKDFATMKEMINVAQNNLAELGVSTKKIDELIEEIRKVDGAAKLCGAGGGGTVLCYHENKSKLLKIIREMEYKPIETSLGDEGVRIES